MVDVKRVDSQAGKNLLVALKSLQNAQARVGWFPSAVYDDEKSTPVAAVAAQNEFGNPAKNIPARPFMRPTIAKKSKEWKAIAEKGAQAVIENQIHVTDVLDLIGQAASADIKETISRLVTPALSPRTIAARLARRSNRKQVGSLTKPLIDTGKMIVSLDYEVDGLP
jgi:hypothetical protein